jgi:hypothetical protein
LLAQAGIGNPPDFGPQLQYVVAQLDSPVRVGRSAAKERASTASPQTFKVTLLLPKEI